MCSVFLYLCDSARNNIIELNSMFILPKHFGKAAKHLAIAFLCVVLFTGCRATCREHAPPRDAGLCHKLEIYIPGTTGTNRQTDTGALVDATLIRLSEAFGGASSYPVRGCWITRNGQPVFEQNTVCYVYCAPTQLADAKRLMADIATEIRDALQQESVAVTIDNTILFY